MVNPEQVRAVVTTAILTAVVDHGPTVISMPGDIAAADAPDHSYYKIAIPATPVFLPADADLDKLAEIIEAASNVALFGGDGCRDARDEVLQLAARLKAPVGYSFRGKQWLEHDNPNAVGMTGLLGYGGAYKAIHNADLVLLLGTDFPFPEFLPGNAVKKVQIDKIRNTSDGEPPLIWRSSAASRQPSPPCSPKSATRPTTAFSKNTSPRPPRSTNSRSTTSRKDRGSSRSVRNSWPRR